MKHNGRKEIERTKRKKEKREWKKMMNTERTKKSIGTSTPSV